MIQSQIDSLLDIGIQLSLQRDHLKLFELIISKSMEITNADAGTLYIVEGDSLKFQIMRNNSLGIYKGANGEIIDLPNVEMKEESVCAYTAIHGEFVNIKDVYCSEKFDFSGPKKYDSLTGYKTTSMMVVPLKDIDGKVMGVLQLINCLDASGEITSFDSKYARTILAIGSQSAVALKNMNYTKEMKNLLYSFVRVISLAVDARTPYNVNHTKNMVRYLDEFVDYINVAHEQGLTTMSFSASHKDRILLAAWLHDMGKIVVPGKIMNKAKRLDNNLDTIKNRMVHIKALKKIEGYKENKTDEQVQKQFDDIDDILNFIIKCNDELFITDEMIARVDEITELVYIDLDNETKPYLLPYEVECLKIRRGSLTDSERVMMNDHVKMTSKMLKELHFTEDLKVVPLWAGDHHERLNGKGYPNHKKAKDISIEARMLAIFDVFEALRSSERPYKKAVTPQKAMDIIEKMVNDGEMDKDIFNLLKQSDVWKT